MAHACGVVPSDVDAGKFCSSPISGNRIGLLKCRKEVIGVSLSNVFDTKVIDDENKGDGTPLVAS